MSLILLGTEVCCSVLSDPGIPDGEQTVWRATKRDSEPELSTVTWRIKDRNGEPVYEITVDSGERKQAKHIIDKSDLRLIWAYVLRDTEDGESEATITVNDENQYLTHNYKNRRENTEIKNYRNGYNGITLPFSLRGFPFGRQEEVELRITPPFKASLPIWIWRMWKSHARSLGIERIIVPAGTFDCYKLEIEASGGLIRRFTSKYYTWFTKEPPHYFVKYQREGGTSVTELMEIRSPGEIKPK
jgi:hypothetical protein